MSTLTIYYGAAKPLHAVGHHQCHLLQFAFDNRGWYSPQRKCPATRRAVAGLERRGYIEVKGTQFQLKIGVNK